MAKVVIVKSATNGLERRNGQQAVMVKRVAQAHTLQASLDLQATITDVTSRNRHVSAMALLQGEGSEDTVNRESVITNMEVPDAGVVKAANSGVFLVTRCCRTDDWTDLEPHRVQSGRGFPGKKRRTIRPYDARASRRRRSWTRRRLVTRVANSDRGHGAGVLDAGVSASMITEQEVLTDQQHKGGDTRVSEQRPRRRRLKDAPAGTPGERGRARIRASGNHVKGAHDRSDRKHPSQESKSTRAMTYDLRTPSSVKNPTHGTCFP